MNTHKKIAFVALLLLVGEITAQITNVRKWRNSEVDSLDQALLFYDDGMFLQACPLFEGILRNHPKEEFIKYSFARCALYRSDKHEEAYKILKELYPKYNDINEMKFDIALASLYELRFDEAEEYLAKFMGDKKISVQDKRRGDALKKNIEYARYYTPIPTQAKVLNLGETINSAGDEYVPTITADDSLLIFTYVGEKSIGGRQNDHLQPDPRGMYMEDLYYSVKHNGEFQNARPIDSLNTNLPDAAISLSNDGITLYLFQNLDDGHGDIYYSQYNGLNYTKPKKMKGLNSFSWDGHCSLSPDGRTMYFSSERVGGFGGRDLYKAEMLPDSSWGNIVNLGDSINTRFDEDAPFMHADGQNFFFSSKGRTSMGGYDIFRNVLNPLDSTFGHSENLGCPINSTDDDIYFVLAANGETGYYSSGRKGGIGLKDIYKVEPNFTKPIVPLELVKGTVLDSTGALEALITIRNESLDVDFGKAHSIKGTGGFLLTLPAGSKYSLKFSARGRATKEVLLDITTLKAYHDTVISVNLSTTRPVLAANKPVETPAGPTLTAQTTSTASTKVTPVAGAAAGVAALAKKTPKDNFVPVTKFQAKTMEYVQKYGDITAPGLEFKVQFAALKSGRTYSYPELVKIGKVERLNSTDGFTRLTVGGTFANLNSAFNVNKKVVKAGHKEAYVICYYNGKRTTFEELEKQNIFVEQP